MILSCTVWSQGTSCTSAVGIASASGKRRRKCGNTYITRCRFGFPWQPCETAKLNPVSDSLKSCSRIYQLKRSESETRVNDYNPLLLLLWKANIDIQFIAESSLALAHYVSGYVTKAEKSSMQDLWQQISDNKSIYGRLWSFISITSMSMFIRSPGQHFDVVCSTFASI